MTITLFSSPKAFTGHFGVIQTNAFRSWAQLSDTDVIIFNSDDTAQAVIKECGFKTFDVDANKNGVPILSQMFQTAVSKAKGDYILFTNADIIHFQTIVDCAKHLSQMYTDYVAYGHRVDLDITEEINFKDGWDKDIQSAANQRGVLHGPTGIDYFLMPKASFERFNMPDFTIGRPGWDQWTLRRIRELGLPSINITADNTVIHQNHDYSHHKDGIQGVWEGEDAQKNRKMAGGSHHAFLTISDATHKLQDGKIIKNDVSALRSFYIWGVTKPVIRPIFVNSNILYSWLRSKLGGAF